MIQPRKWLLAWLRFGECSETPVDCNGLFRVEEGCVPWHGKWRTLIPQELWPVIFFSWTENLRQLFWADSITPFSPYFLPSIECHINTLPSPSQHLLLQPGSEQELLAWAINYKQPCLRLGRNDCRKPAQWCTANTPSPKYSYSQYKTNIVIFVFIWLDIVINHITIILLHNTIKVQQLFGFILKKISTFFIFA